MPTHHEHKEEIAENVGVVRPDLVGQDAAAESADHGATVLDDSAKLAHCIHVRVENGAEDVKGQLTEDKEPEYRALPIVHMSR